MVVPIQGLSDHPHHQVSLWGRGNHVSGRPNTRKDILGRLFPPRCTSVAREQEPPLDPAQRIGLQDLAQELQNLETTDVNSRPGSHSHPPTLGSSSPGAPGRGRAEGGGVAGSGTSAGRAWRRAGGPASRSGPSTGSSGGRTPPPPVPGVTFQI